MPGVKSVGNLIAAQRMNKEGMMTKKQMIKYLKTNGASINFVKNKETELGDWAYELRVKEEKIKKERAELEQGLRVKEEKIKKERAEFEQEKWEVMEEKIRLVAKESELEKKTEKFRKEIEKWEKKHEERRSSPQHRARHAHTHNKRRCSRDRSREKEKRASRDSEDLRGRITGRAQVKKNDKDSRRVVLHH
jgi:hypothetical protein